jgi:colicin import membrane protein
MATETIAKPNKTLPPGEDPFRLGWRYVPKQGVDGTKTWEQVGLTEWDVLHPMEEDFIAQNDAHSRDCFYLKGVFEQLVSQRTDTISFCDMRIDWQLGEESVFGPDICVFDEVDTSIPWPPLKGTSRVKEMRARSVVMIEVTSPTTRDKDVGVKIGLYEKVGVPLYIIVDQGEDLEQIQLTVYGYRMTSTGYERIPNNPNGVWIEALRVWIRAEEDRVVCVDEQGHRIPDRLELVDDRDKQKQRAEKAEQRAQSAEQMAEMEKQRAEESACKIAELEAELRRLRGETK